MNSDLVAELRSWIAWPEKELDVLLRNAADEMERLQKLATQFQRDNSALISRLAKYERATDS